MLEPLCPGYKCLYSHALLFLTLRMTLSHVLPNFGETPRYDDVNFCRVVELVGGKTEESVKEFLVHIESAI